MTNEEAIKHVENMKKGVFLFHPNELYDTIINALKDRPTGKWKEEILEYFKDINLAYNDCTRFDTLKRMLGELEQEQRTGHWKDIDNNRVECSECGHKECSERFMFEDINYCTRCGAKME